MQQESDMFQPDHEPTLPGAFARVARAVATRLGLGASEPLESPFRDSDFEVESNFFGRPLGDH